MKLTFKLSFNSETYKEYDVVEQSSILGVISLRCGAGNTECVYTPLVIYDTVTDLTSDVVRQIADKMTEIEQTLT